MTLYDLLGILWRRWYVLLVVFALTAAGGWVFAKDGGLYVTRTLVSFEAPDSGPWEEGGSSDRGIILFAAAVATEVNGGAAPMNYSSADAPFYGAGIRQGVRVGLPDTGGQWGVVYNKAAITIDVVSADRDWVADRQRELLVAVADAAAQRQGGIPRENQIVVSVEPLSETIAQVSPTRITQALAVAALAAVALLAGGWLAVAWDRRRRAAGERSDGVNGLRRLMGGREIS